MNRLQMRMIIGKISCLLVMAIVFSACAQKVYPNKNNEHFTVKKAFIQTEIPGIEKAKVIDYLNLVMEPNPSNYVVFDSVLYDGKILKMNSLKGAWKLNRALGTLAQEQYTMKSNEAILFYTVKGKNYKYTIANIESKPALYLP